MIFQGFARYSSLILGNLRRHRRWGNCSDDVDAVDINCGLKMALARGQVESG